MQVKMFYADPPILNGCKTHALLRSGGLNFTTTVCVSEQQSRTSASKDSQITLFLLSVFLKVILGFIEACGSVFPAAV